MTKIRESNCPIGDLVQGPAIVVDAKATLREVAASLGDLGIGMVVVVEDGKIAGVVSERDLVCGRSLATLISMSCGRLML